LSANGGSSYTRQPASAVSNSASATTAISPSNTSNYTVTVFNSALGNNCIKTLTTSAVVNFSPTASFTYSQNPCGGGVYFTNTSSTNSATFNWTLTPVFSSTLQNPYYFYSNGGAQNVSLVVTTTAGCTHSVTENINVIVPPPVSIGASPKICLGELASLTAGGGVSYSWTPSQTLAFPNSANTTASPTVSTTYSVIITTSTGCQFVLFSNVTVDYPSSLPVSANANPQKVILGDNSTLVYVGDPGATVTWFPAGSTVPATGYTVTATPSLATTYTAIAQYGVCRNNATTRVEVVSNSCVDKDTFVPNTFTPNSDGENDVLYVRSAFIEQIYFAVYNRWGELVFETTDKTKGWDGLYKGRPADVGVFGWYLKVKCPNGEENFKKGNVTLIR
jgi:gliding motility-associated-like protein